MRKRKIAAAVMALVMTAGIYSPIQAAGYCINGNGGNCRIVVGGNCNNSSSNSCNSNGCYNNSCLDSGNSCNSGDNSCSNVKGSSDSKSCDQNSCGQGGNAYKIVIGNGCGNLQSGNVKSADDINEFIKENLPSCQSGNAQESANDTQKKTQGYTAQNGSCSPSVTQRSTVQSGSTCQPKQTDKAAQKPSVKQENNCPYRQTGKTTQPVPQRQATEGKSMKTEKNTGQTTTERRITENVTTQEKTTEIITTEQEVTEKTTEETLQDSMSDDQSAAASSVLDLVNQNRASAGLHALKLDASLCAAAQIRANEIVKSFSHTRPDGRKFSTVLTDNGIRFTAAGENIAWGQTSPSQVMNAWMNSDGHRANIMNSTYTKLGVGHVTVNGRQYWVQLFSY